MVPREHPDSSRGNRENRTAVSAGTSRVIKIEEPILLPNGQVQGEVSIQEIVEKIGKARDQISLIPPEVRRKEAIYEDSGYFNRELPQLFGIGRLPNYSVLGSFINNCLLRFYLRNSRAHDFSDVSNISDIFWRDQSWSLAEEFFRNLSFGDEDYNSFKKGDFSPLIRVLEENQILDRQFLESNPRRSQEIWEEQKKISKSCSSELERIELQSRYLSENKKEELIKKVIDEHLRLLLYKILKIRFYERAVWGTLSEFIFVRSIIEIANNNKRKSEDIRLFHSLEAFYDPLKSYRGFYQRLRSGQIDPLGREAVAVSLHEDTLLQVDILLKTKRGGYLCQIKTIPIPIELLESFLKKLRFFYPIVLNFQEGPREDLSMNLWQSNSLSSIIDLQKSLNGFSEEFYLLDNFLKPLEYYNDWARKVVETAQNLLLLNRLGQYSNLTPLLVIMPRYGLWRAREYGAALRKKFSDEFQEL